MAGETKNGEDLPNYDELIAQLYDVALDASRYENLRQAWEKMARESPPVSSHASPMETAQLRSHFERAMEVMQQMEFSAAQDDLWALLSSFDKVAAFVIDSNLRIAAVNGTAGIYLGILPGMVLSALPISEEDKAIFPAQAKRMLVDSKSVPAIHRIRSSDESSFLIFQLKRIVMKSGDVAILVVSSGLGWPARFQDVLQEAFGLSLAEIEVVRSLVDCCSVKDIAKERGRSIDTVRAQIKAILAKTETRSQVELMRLVLSMMDIASTSTNSIEDVHKTNGGNGSLKVIPYRTVYTKNGRKLDYLLLGDPKGKPLLFITSEYSFVRWPATAEAYAARRGIKVIVPIRGGYGDCDPLPDHMPFCEAVAHDIMTVLDAENVSSLPVITLSDDHHFATQIEKMRSGTITAVIAAGGGLPFLNELQVTRMHKWYRFIQACARNTPNMLPYMLKMGFYLVKKIGVKSFLQTIYSDSSADLEVLENPECMEAFLASSELGLSDLSKVVETFSKQTIFEQEPWLRAHVNWMRDRVPMHFFCGLQDPSQPIDTLAEQRSYFGWIDFRIYPDAGQLLLFKHWDEVLELSEEYL